MTAAPDEPPPLDRPVSGEIGHGDGNASVPARPDRAGETAGTRPTHSLSLQLTQETIEEWAALSGDRNPLHVSPSWAATTRFGGTIAHGHFSVAILERLMMAVAGEAWLEGGTLSDVRFTAPLRPGRALVASASPRVETTTGAIGDFDVRITQRDDDGGAGGRGAGGGAGGGGETVAVTGVATLGSPAGEVPVA